MSRIQRLYIAKLSLCNSERQLKRKITTWGLDKKVKEHEMVGIVKKQARLKAQGKVAAFRVRGLPVQQAKVDRWQKRTSYSQPELLAQQDTESRKPALSLGIR